MKSKLPLILVALLLVAAVAVVLFVFVLGGEKDEGPPIVRTEFVPGEHFVGNIKHPSTRLLKTTIVLVLDTDTLNDFLAERTAEIRDSITTILRAQDEDTLRSVDLTGLKDEIRSTLNERLEIENITDILITDIAVQ